MRIIAVVVVMVPLLSACAGRASRGPLIPDEAKGSRFDPRAHYKVGNPYQIKGIWYYPKEDFSYDETGIASWYGSDFHQQRTANGEIYNKNELTAAHKTLPLPSLARVTNMDNGRSVVVRVNDRGPFSGARIIDVSQRSAQLLGFEGQGTAKVRVQVLADESKAIADAMRRYGEPAEPLPERVEQNVASQERVETIVLPQTRAEARSMLSTIKPVAEARQMAVVGGTQIFVQAGSFAQRENAVRLRDKLSGTVGNASVSEAVVNGATYYRVRVGPVPDVKTADATLQKVRRAGFDQARTIVDAPES